MAIWDVGEGYPYATIDDAVWALWLKYIPIGYTFTETETIILHDSTCSPKNIIWLWGTDAFPLIIMPAEGNSCSVLTQMMIQNTGVIIQGLNFVYPPSFYLTRDVCEITTNGKIIFRNNECTGINSNEPINVVVNNFNYDNSTEIWIYNNIFRDIGSGGINVQLDSGHFTPRIYNNTFYYSNADTTYGAIIFSNITTEIFENEVYIENNIFYIDGLSADLGDGKVPFLYYSSKGVSECHINNNCYYLTNGAKMAIDIDTFNYKDTLADWKTYSNQDANSFEANPLFEDILNYNFHILPLSPCVKIGADLTTYFTTDKDNNSRVVPFDIGAYEYQKPIPPLPPGPRNKICERNLFAIRNLSSI